MKWSNSNKSSLIFQNQNTASWPFWDTSNGKMYEVQIENTKTGCSCGRPLSTVLSHLFAYPPFFHQVKEADKFVVVNPHLPWLLCAVDQQRGTLLQDRSYTVECFTKEFKYTFIKVVRSGCTLRRCGINAGGKGGWVGFVWGGVFLFGCVFSPLSPFLCCYKWQLNTFCPLTTRCAYASSYRAKIASEFQ